MILIKILFFALTVSCLLSQLTFSNSVTQDQKTSHQTNHDDDDDLDLKHPDHVNGEFDNNNKVKLTSNHPTMSTKKLDSVTLSAKTTTTPTPTPKSGSLATSTTFKQKPSTTKKPISSKPKQTNKKCKCYARKMFGKAKCKPTKDSNPSCKCKTSFRGCVSKKRQFTDEQTDSEVDLKPISTTTTSTEKSHQGVEFDCRCIKISGRCVLMDSIRECRCLDMDGSCLSRYSNQNNQTNSAHWILFGGKGKGKGRSKGRGRGQDQGQSQSQGQREKIRDESQEKRKVNDRARGNQNQNQKPKPNPNPNLNLNLKRYRHNRLDYQDQYGFFSSS